MPFQRRAALEKPDGPVWVGTVSLLFGRAAAGPCAALGPDRPKLDFRCRSGPVGAAVTQPSNGPMTGAAGSGPWAAKTQRQEAALTGRSS